MINAMYKYFIYTLIALVVIGGVTAATTLLGTKAEPIPVDVKVDETIDISQAAIDQATKLGYKDISEAVKIEGVDGLEQKALIAEETKQMDYFRQVQAMKDLDTLIKVNDCYASVLASKTGLNQEPVPGEPLKAG